MVIFLPFLFKETLTTVSWEFWLKNCERFFVVLVSKLFKDKITSPGIIPPKCAGDFLTTLVIINPSFGFKLRLFSSINSFVRGLNSTPIHGFDLVSAFKIFEVKKKN